VDELQRVLDAVGRERSAIALDLAGVSFVDDAGERLLRRALARGPMRHPSPYLTALLDRGDREVASALLGGDEATFARLVDRLHPAAVLLARCFVPTDALARKAAASAWKAFLEGLDGWRGWPSLRALLFRNVLDTARALGADVAPWPRPGDVPEGDEAAVVSARFRPPRHPERALPSGDLPARWPDGQRDPPRLAETVGAAIAALPQMPRAVITLRDVAGCDAAETCCVLGLAEATQRALLHRARTAVRAAVEARPAAAA